MRYNNHRHSIPRFTFIKKGHVSGFVIIPVLLGEGEEEKRITFKHGGSIE